MFGLRFLRDNQNFRKKGQPPHHTTGVARTSSTYLEYLNCAANPSIGAIAMNSSGALSTALTQRRRVRSRSSALSSTPPSIDRKSTRLNSSHGYISYAVFCLKKKKKKIKKI